MISNNYIIKIKGNKPLDLRVLQEIIKREISKWDEKINVRLFEPIKVQTKYPGLNPMSIAQVSYGKSGFDSVLVTEVNDKNKEYLISPELNFLIPFYHMEVGVSGVDDDLLSPKQLGQYRGLAKTIKQEVPGIEHLFLFDDVLSTKL